MQHYNKVENLTFLHKGFTLHEVQRTMSKEHSQKHSNYSNDDK